MRSRPHQQNPVYLLRSSHSPEDHVKEVPSPRGGGAQEGPDLAGLDPAEWLELEQLLEHREPSAGGHRTSMTPRRVCTGCLRWRGGALCPGRSAETHREHVTRPTRPPAPEMRVLQVGSALISIALAPAGSHNLPGQCSNFDSLSRPGSDKARPPTKGCVFLIYSHHIAFENQNLQAITQEIIIKSFVHFY